MGRMLERRGAGPRQKVFKIIARANEITQVKWIKVEMETIMSRSTPVADRPLASSAAKEAGKIFAAVEVDVCALWRLMYANCDSICIDVYSPSDGSAV
jgi:hypothetical protein